MLKREPVSIDRYKRFHFWLIEQSYMYGVLEDQDVRRAVEILVEKIEDHIGKTTPKKAKNPHQKKVWQFVQIFKQKYLEWKDLEYEVSTFGGKEIKIIGNLIEKLDKHEVSIEEYLTWLFDEFYPVKENLTATIPLSVNNKILQEYLYKNADVLKKRKNLKKVEFEEEVLLRKARVLFRATQDKAVIDVMQAYQDSNLTIGGFAGKINELSKKHEKIIANML